MSGVCKPPLSDQAELERSWVAELHVCDGLADERGRESYRKTASGEEEGLVTIAYNRVANKQRGRDVALIKRRGLEG